MKEALQVLLSDGVIEEIVSRLKSGKEADVYLVVHKNEIVAAKIYKERQQRSFRNNADYKEGRQVRNSRTARAIAKGSRFGQSAAEDAWKTTEADALGKLHAAGVRVPSPVMYYEGVLLMEVVLDPTGHPAPRLIDAPLTHETAAEVYRDLRNQTTRMLCNDLIHGDLSPYNILMAWNGPTIIDFPQVVNAAANSRAEFFFKRDLENLHRFFATIDPSLMARSGDAYEIWRAYTRRELTPDFEPSGRMAPPEERRSHRGPPREQRGPPREHRGPPPPRPENIPPPAPVAAPEEDEFALLRQGGGERPRVQDLARTKGGPRGGPRRGRGGPGGPPSNGPPRGPPQGAPMEQRGPRPEGAPPHRAPRTEGAHANRGPRPEGAPPHRGERTHPGAGSNGHGNRPQGQGPRHGPGPQGAGPRHGRGQANPAVTYVARQSSASGPTESPRPEAEGQGQGSGHAGSHPSSSRPPSSGGRQGGPHHRRQG
jgi:RIO kinase 1